MPLHIFRYRPVAASSARIEIALVLGRATEIISRHHHVVGIREHHRIVDIGGAIVGIERKLAVFAECLSKLLHHASVVFVILGRCCMTSPGRSGEFPVEVDSRQSVAIYKSLAVGGESFAL